MQEFEGGRRGQTKGHLDMKTFKSHSEKIRQIVW